MQDFVLKSMIKTQMKELTKIDGVTTIDTLFHNLDASKIETPRAVRDAKIDYLHSLSPHYTWTEKLDKRVAMKAALEDWLAALSPATVEKFVFMDNKTTVRLEWDSREKGSIKMADTTINIQWLREVLKDLETEHGA